VVEAYKLVAPQRPRIIRLQRRKENVLLLWKCW